MDSSRGVPILLLCVLAGCLPAVKDKSSGNSGGKGSGGSGGGSSSDGGAAPGTPPPTQLPALDACGSNPAKPGPRVLRRLTQAQLNATLKDLFRDQSVPQASFFADPPLLGFTVDANALVVQDLTAQQLSDFADQVATWVDTHPSSVTSCTTRDATCVGQFIAAFGKRAFRAPLTGAQLSAYTTLFNAQGNFNDGLHTVVAAMLQSPYFLYHQELGTPNADGSLFNLTPYEIASSLSYLLIGSMPDDALFGAADADQLSTPAELDAQAKRLLADPRAQSAVADFMTGWLGLDRVLTIVKDTSVYGALTPALRTSMYNESRALLVDAFTSGHTFGDALTADYSFVDAGLGQYYGVPGGGAAATRVMLPAGVRDKGLLAHGAITTGYADADISSPVQRGKLVRLRLLCQSLPPPPGGVATALAPATGVQTTRQHFEQHDKTEPCAGCHQYIDPVGFGFESYDGIGRRRTMDNGLPVDPSGTVKAMGSQKSDVSFADLNGLATFLASDPDVNSCMARYWTYYAFGMSGWPEDGCTHDAIAGSASMNGYTLASVLTAIWHAPHFITRVADQ
jgi:hypothetical protein